MKIDLTDEDAQKLINRGKMKLDLTDEDAQKLINSQRAEIDKLKGRLNKIAEAVKSMAAYDGKLPEEFLKTATDLCGRYFSSISENWLEEMQEVYLTELRKKPYDRMKLKFFSEHFLFATLGDEPYKMNNIRYNLREIMELSGTEVPDWLK